MRDEGRIRRVRAGAVVVVSGTVEAVEQERRHLLAPLGRRLDPLHVVSRVAAVERLEEREWHNLHARDGDAPRGEAEEGADGRLLSGDLE